MLTSASEKPRKVKNVNGLIKADKKAGWPNGNYVPNNGILLWLKLIYSPFYNVYI